MAKWRLIAAVVFCLLFGAAAQARDDTSRIAVMSAFDAELALLLKAVGDPQQVEIAGIDFTTGTIDGRPVVLFLSGISMVNAAMATQVALDHFTVNSIVFSGIAGGVDPALEIGDVVIPERWGQYLENVLARETPEGWQLPQGMTRKFANFGMIFPQTVRIAGQGAATEERFWFEADPAMLAVARQVSGQVTLEKCATAGRCLGRQPRLTVGGNGVSGQSFVDNAAFRAYVFATFQARVLDMESAAVAQVARANGTPFIVFRSLSDLAGGGPGENEIGTFFQFAANNSATVVKAFLAAWVPPKP
ncbi:5'-methylthioadenosine/S-adenosylhomocysteine nucleosidase [Oleomonas cavernae]|nr:5'-methylthioadenosine/S-adenosylhomocysteine nucleosidase [Oleomonas cavernae]